MRNTIDKMKNAAAQRRPREATFEIDDIDLQYAMRHFAMTEAGAIRQLALRHLEGLNLADGEVKFTFTRFDNRPFVTQVKAVVVTS